MLDSLAALTATGAPANSDGGIAGPLGESQTAESIRKANELVTVTKGALLAVALFALLISRFWGTIRGSEGLDRAVRGTPGSGVRKVKGDPINPPLGVPRA
jgi:hypothetical protein